MHTSSNIFLDMENRRVAMNFAEWLTEQEYITAEEAEEDIDEMIADFTLLHNEIPRLFNILRDITDR